MMVRGIIVALLMLASGAGARAEPREIYAVIIGHNGGRPAAGLPELRYADDDAVRFARFFSGVSGATARVWLLTRLDGDTRRQLDEAGIASPPHVSPTRSALTTAFAQLARALAARGPGPERVLYVVYAGHGLHGRVLLEPEGAAEAAITGAELRAALAELAQVDPQLRMLLFIDACRSQSLFGVRDGEVGPDFSTEVSALERRAESLRLGVLTAASAGKPAGEVEDLGAGYFSHALASGLAGAADADGNEVVSFGELAAFVAFNTRRLTGQLPWFDPPGGDLGSMAMDLRGRLPRLVIPAGDRGRFLVEARGGPPVFAEAYKDAQRPLQLALPPGHYRLRRSAEGRVQAAPAVLQAGQLLDAGALAWADSGATRTEARGGAGAPPEIDLAFSTAFTSEAVSTLEAGFRAGREPSSALAARRTMIGLTGSAGAVPRGLTGVAAGAALAARHRLGEWAVAGLRLSFASSSHSTGREDYRLQRAGLLAEGGLRLGLASWFDLHGLLGAGAAATVRRSAGPAAGDLFGPLLSAGLGSQWSLGRGWALLVEGRYQVHWIRIDGARSANGGMMIDVGLGWGP